MRHIFLFLIILPVLITSCQLGQEEPPVNDAPIVQIDSPASNARIPVGQEIEIKSTANDESSIQRIELYINDDLMQKDAPPIANGQLSFTVLQRWIPAESGLVKVYVIAYDNEGKASRPAAIMLEVIGDSSVAALPTVAPSTTTVALSTATALPPSNIAPTPTTEAISMSNMPAAAVIPVVEGRLISAIPINIYIAPGTENSPIGVLNPNDVVIGVARNAVGDWIKIIYGAENTEGWVFADLFAWQGNIQALAVE